MRKNWEEALLENISIEETAGGTINTGKPDGPIFQGSDGKWYQPIGEDPENRHS